MDLRCYIFNDVDGSVKIACEGIQKSIDTFINNIKEFARSDIESIEKKEVFEELFLPYIFSRVATDDYYEFGKKLDIGVGLLDGIKTDTWEMKGTLGEMKGTLGEMKGTLGEMKGTLGEMKGTLGEMKESLTKINVTLEAFTIKQDGHNQRLEKILEKLAER